MTEQDKSFIDARLLWLRRRGKDTNLAYPTKAELDAFADGWQAARTEVAPIFYANPKQVPQRGEAVNVAHNYIDGLAPGHGYHLTPKGIRMLADAVILMDAWISEVTKRSASSPPQESEGSSPMPQFYCKAATKCLKQCGMCAHISAAI